MTSTPTALDNISNKLRPFLEAFRGESDRGVAVLAMCVLEECVREAIVKRLGPFEHEIAQICAPKGKWSTLAKFAEAFGLIPSSERKDLEKLVEVRNRFAHAALTTLSFADPGILKVVKSLSVFDSLMGDEQTSAKIVREQGARVKYIATVGMLYVLISGRALEAKPLRRCDETTPNEPETYLIAGGW